nr:hypothetical protein [Sphingobium sp. Sx8-8]
MAGVAIHGAGVAAACCDHLLRRAGLPVCWTNERRTPAPAIMLSDSARALLRDALSRPDLFADRPRIGRRIVAWGGQAPVEMPHAAVMLALDDLAFAPTPLGQPLLPPPFVIRAGPPPEGEAMLRFGQRSAEVGLVSLLMAEDSDACWVEAVADGWLFLTPAGEGIGWLLAVGGSGDRLLGQSRHLRDRIVLERDDVRRFDSSPRMLAAMQGANWLACGSGSIGFDPICGDGTALAVRQGILASAIVVALEEGEDAADLLGHYRAMMTAALRRHLRLCADFYASGGSGPWWRAQQRAIAEGFAACTARLEREAPPRFALEGFRLVRRALAA